MKKWLLAVVFGTALVLGACGGGGDDASDDAGDSGDAAGETAAAGEEVYESNCAACHGQDLSGQSGPALDKAGATHSSDEIVDIIQNGTGTMPAQGQVSEEDAKAVADWLADKK